MSARPTVVSRCTGWRQKPTSASTHTQSCQLRGILNSNIKIQSNNNFINEGKFIGINNTGALKINSIKDGKIYEYEYGDISIKGVY